MTTSVNPLTSHQYWESLRTQGFCLPQCQACKEFHFYLRPACPACGSLNIQAVVTSGRGNVYSFSIVYRAPSPAFEKDVPYVVAIVATDEGPHLMTRLIKVKPEEVTVGMRVMVSGWRTRDEPAELLSDGVAPPLFEPESL
ncbi:COG1545 Predicted nucleic-acid-binding protein containing a Zn-ribbon [Burkholderiaceae bacterium]